jgi:hypothetical protein
VVVALALGLADQPALLQQVLGDAAPDNVAHAGIELDLDPLQRVRFTIYICNLLVYGYLFLVRISNSDQTNKVCLSEVQTVTNKYLLTDSF